MNNADFSNHTETRTILLDEKTMKPQNWDASPVDHKPRLFACHGQEITEYPLAGRQVVGRPSDTNTPDIQMRSSYVSRTHGYFDTIAGHVFYTAANTTNATMYHDRRLQPGEQIELTDGDELMIPSPDEHILFHCATSENMIAIWRNMMLASRDALTGLSRRSAFTDWYRLNICSKASPKNTAVFILDIDNFKGVNDTYGHTGGDSALKTVAGLLADMVAPDGSACRWGGDEFVGVLRDPKTSPEKHLKALRKQVERMLIEDRFKITISIGYIMVTEPLRTYPVDDMIDMADRALYASKEHGRNRITEAKP